MPGVDSVLPGVIRRSYLRKFALVVLLMLVVTAGAGWYFQQGVSESLTEQTHANMEAIAAQEAAKLSQWEGEQRQQTATLSSRTLFQESDQSSIGISLSFILEDMPESVTALHYIDLESGEILESTRDDWQGRQIEERLAWRNADGLDLPFLTSVQSSHVFQTDGTSKLAFASPTKVNTRAVVVVVETTGLMNSFQNPYENGSTQVVDSRGTVEFADNRSQILTTYGDDTGQEILRAGRNGSGATDQDASGRVVAYAPANGTSWVVLSQAPQGSAYAVRSTVQRDFATLVGIALAGLLFVGLTIGRTTVRSLRTLTSKARELEEGNLDTTIGSSRSDEIGDLFEAFDSMRDSLQRRIAEAEDAIERARASSDEAQEARKEAERAKAEAEQLSDHLEQKADEYEAVIEEVAAGDLTQRLNTDSESDAMTDIGVTLNEMLDEIEATIADIQVFSRQVERASEEASTAAREVQEVSDTVSNAIGEIADGTDEQREKLDQVSEEMNSLSATIEEAATTTETVARTAEETTEIVAEGKATASEAINEMEAVRETIARTVDDVETLEELVSEIDEIVELISDIAAQTNMLALNANIEAARAGTGGAAAGEGFAVVADEVKQLATETQQAAEEVATLIEEVQTQTGQTVEEIQSAESRVRETTTAVEDAINAFVEVSENIQETNDGVQEVSLAMDDQAASAEETVTMAEAVADISRSTADEAADVSAAAQQRASSMTQVTGNVESLLDQAEQLRARLESFSVDQGVAASPDGDSTTAADD